MNPYTTLLNYDSEDDSEHETTNTEYSSQILNESENNETKVSCCTIL